MSRGMDDTAGAASRALPGSVAHATLPLGFASCSTTAPMKSIARVLAPLALSTALLAAACAARNHAPRPDAGTGSPSAAAPTLSQRGYATYYARFFHGRTSASGERFDERKLVAAHRTLPFGSIVRVTNVRNGRSVTVRIIDRGPYGQNYREGTIIDVSHAAARRLRMLRDGQVPARVDVLKRGSGV
jgi:rare lipoprotein A